MKQKAAVNFLVDTVSDPLEVKKAIRGLRAVRRLGLLAERALERLERDGKFDGRAPWLNRETYGRGYVLKYSRFPSMPEILRSDVPGYGPVRFRLARQPNPGPGPEFLNPDYLDVLVSGAVPELVLTERERASVWRSLNVEVPPESTGTLVPGEKKVGTIRLTSNGGTFYPESPSPSSSKSRSIALVKNQDAFAIRRVSTIVPMVLCGAVAESHPRIAVYCRNLQRWLHEDGHAERFLLDMREAAIKYKTVKQVLTD